MQWFMLCVLLQDPPSLLFPTDGTPTVQVEPSAVEATTTLQIDEVLVIRRSAPTLILASPAGVVQIEHETGPLKIFAKTKGSSHAVWSVYDDPQWPHIYLLTPIATGTVEVLAADSLDVATVLRQQLTVVGGGPRPPPTPEPSPKPPAPRPADGELRVMLLIDETDDVAALTAVRSEAVTTWLTANCTRVGGRAEWRVYDASSIADDGALTDESPVWNKLYASVKNRLPAGPSCVIARGTAVQISPFANSESLLALLRASQ